MIQIYHFNNGAGGGVFSVIRNLLQYSQNSAIENHVIYTINTAQNPHFVKPNLVGATSEKVFYYSPRWNFYHTCKALAKLLPNEKAIIIAHDWLELGMVSNLGLPNPVVHILHGDFDYYYHLAEKHVRNIGAFIAVSKVIAHKLEGVLPMATNKIHYLRFPTPLVDTSHLQYDAVRVVYCVNDLNDERKQFQIIPKIAKEVQALEANVEWYIVGRGLTEQQIQTRFGPNLKRSVNYLGYLNSQELSILLSKVNMLILPSLQEGLPVIVVEAMKHGIVPLVTQWGEATEEFIIHGQSGYTFTVGDVRGYAQTIVALKGNSQLHRQMGQEAKALANQYFDPVINTKAYEEIFIKALPQIQQPFKAYGSRLDNRWIPNKIVSILRNK